MRQINLTDVEQLVALFAQPAFTVHAKDLIAASAEAVIREVTIMDTHKQDDPQAWARQCLIFAILSPQLRFRHNVELTRAVYEALPKLSTRKDVEAVLFVTTEQGRPGRVNGWRSKARYIHQSLDFIRTITPDQMTKDALQAAAHAGTLIGMGEKAQSMAIALFDADAPVYTLDGWMLRFLLDAAGEDASVGESPVITKAAYRKLEQAFVAWAKQTFPKLPVFVTQWAIWNGSAFGHHISHLPIFGLTVS